MSGYVLIRTDDGAFVARRGSAGSYTRDVLRAQVYPTREAADRDRCPGNEAIVPIDALFRD